MGSATIAPAFTGVSSYASDLRSVITRAVAIASMPLQQLQSQLQDLNGRATALNGLNSTFSNLQSAIQNLGSALGANSYSASSSDPSLVSASASAGALNGSYTLSVVNPGSYSSAVSADSLPAVSDPYSTSISVSTDYTLTVNGKTFDLQTSDASLMTLAQSINAASAGVHASVVNTGGSATPHYRLVLRSDTLGADSIQLNDGSQDLLASLGTGEEAGYILNGLSGTIQSTSRSVTLAPGVTANILGATPSGQPVTVTVSRSSAALSSALSVFASAYNAAVDALDAQFGSNAGQLSGQSVVRALSQSLRSIAQFTGASGTVTSMAQMGLTLDNQGHLSLDETTLNATSIDSLQAFLGDASTGGFLKSATDILKSIENPDYGSLEVAIQQTKSETAAQNQQIADQQKRVDDLQGNLEEQMAAADALLASLESQKTYMNNLFTAMMNANNNGGVKSS